MDENKKKLLKIFWFFGIIFFLVFLKAFKVQVLDREMLLSRARSQFLRETKVYPKRGNIYDRDGNPLAINIQTYNLFTIPGNNKQDQESYRKLSKFVPELSYKKILNIVKERKRFTWLARKVQLKEEIVQEIKKIPRIYVEAVPKRIYPNKEVLSQVLGFVGVDNKGLSGLEYMYDEDLKGGPTEIKYIVDNKGRAIKFQSSNNGTPAKDLHLTIDKELQAAAERFLKEAVIEHKALKGGVGVMDAETGEVLAVANYPTFDPNNVTESRPEDRKLAFVTDPFEPGSIFKILTAASALQNGVARFDTSYYCEKGQLLIDGHEISEAGSKKQFEWLSVADIIRYSSNIGTTKIAFDLTYPKLKATLIDFGIGEKTNIEIPGESRGIFDKEVSDIRPIRLSNVSFGQGVATTGIQMLAAYAALANGGIYYPPTIVKNKKNMGRRVIDTSVAKSLNKMLLLAVDDGTGQNAKIPYFKIAGKTSTAQRPDKNGGYSGYISGFIGFPLNVHKKFVIYVYVDNPQGKHTYGNLVAAPVFKKIAQHILYKDKEYDQLVLDSQEGHKILDSVKIKQAALRIQGENLVPNFVGLDKVSSKKLAEKLDILLEHHGVGLIKQQEPLPGGGLDESTVVKLYYSPPRYD